MMHRRPFPFLVVGELDTVVHHSRIRRSDAPMITLPSDRRVHGIHTDIRPQSTRAEEPQADIAGDVIRSGGVVFVLFHNHS